MSAAVLDRAALRLSLYVRSWDGQRRRMHCCTCPTPACSHAGIFYTHSSGDARVMEAVLDLVMMTPSEAMLWSGGTLIRNRDVSTGAASFFESRCGDASEGPLHVPEVAWAHLASTPPTATFVTEALTCTVLPGKVCWVPEPSPTCPSHGRWVITFRPEATARIAFLRCTTGGTTIVSPGFRVLHKPSAWVVVQNLPRVWTAACLKEMLERVGYGPCWRVSQCTVSGVDPETGVRTGFALTHSTDLWRDLFQNWDERAEEYRCSLGVIGGGGSASVGRAEGSAPRPFSGGPWFLSAVPTLTRMSLARDRPLTRLCLRTGLLQAVTPVRPGSRAWNNNTLRVSRKRQLVNEPPTLVPVVPAPPSPPYLALPQPIQAEEREGRVDVVGTVDGFRVSEPRRLPMSTPKTFIAPPPKSSLEPPALPTTRVLTPVHDFLRQTTALTTFAEALPRVLPVGLASHVAATVEGNHDRAIASRFPFSFGGALGADSSEDDLQELVTFTAQATTDWPDLFEWDLN